MALDFVIIGGGPAGHTAATHAARLGARVTIIERDIVGGAAHLWDCIPSKAMIATGGAMALTKRAEAMADFVVAESPYSASKIAGEAFIYSYAKCYGMPALVYRFSNVYGRYDNDLDRMERVIPLFVRELAAGNPITVYGREKMLDFTFVDDCVAGVIAGIDAIVDGKVLRDTVNLAYGQGNTLLDLVSLLELCLGTKADVTYQEPLVGEVTRYIADISKAKRLLGYQPQVPLSVGIPRYVDWWRERGLL